MNRRNFLSLFGAGVAGIALKEAIPLGRVWSFPTNIIARPRLLNDELGIFADHFNFNHQLRVGSTIRIRMPQRFIVRDYIGDFSKPPSHLTVTLMDADMVREVSKLFTAAFPPEPRP